MRTTTMSGWRTYSPQVDEVGFVTPRAPHVRAVPVCHAIGASRRGVFILKSVISALEFGVGLPCARTVPSTATSSAPPSWKRSRQNRQSASGSIVSGQKAR